MNTLQTLIRAVDDNNQFNDAQWTDWQDADHIADTYQETIDDQEREWLNRLIESNGDPDVKNAVLLEMDKRDYGPDFPGYAR